jgi:hypothetical protein
VLGIELHVNARVILPGSSEQERRYRAGRVSNREAPNENPNLEFGSRLDKRAQQLADWRRLSSVNIRTQANAPVEIPADDQDRPRGLAEGVLKMSEIGPAIDQNGGLVSLLDLRAIPSRTEHTPISPDGQVIGSSRSGSVETFISAPCSRWIV